MHFLLRYLLFPFSVLYQVVTSFRNFLYNKKILRSIEFDIKTIVVGNLTVGGTGKTPMVEYLIRLLSNEYKIAVLSRGYGRKTKGFLLADETSTAYTLGDEPMQIYTKFKNKVIVAVGEDRVLAIPSILTAHPDINLIILDDAFQHRRIKGSLSILLTDYRRLFYKDFVLPTGWLRESRRGARRADVIVITKCSMGLTESEMNKVENKIRKYTDVPVFFSGIQYHTPVPLFDLSSLFSKNIVLVSGIAKTEELVEYVKSNFNLVNHIRLSDHHQYMLKDIQSIKKEFDKINLDSKIILLTEKDAAKWNNSVFEKELSGISVFYLPIETVFLKNKKEFDEKMS